MARPATPESGIQVVITNQAHTILAETCGVRPVGNRQLTLLFMFPGILECLPGLDGMTPANRS